MAHTLHEDRDLNSPSELFDELSGGKVDPEMVQLTTQLIQRQAGKYDPGDLEDRYEARLRALIDAKLKGEGVDLEADVTPRRETNVVDLMSVLKDSLGQTPTQDVAKQPEKKRTKAPTSKRAAAAQAATGKPRKRA
jgi:DNA end-binding protein Ku